MPRLNFEGNAAQISGLTPASIGAASAAVVTAQAQRIADLEGQVATADTAQAQRIADLEARVASLDQQLSTVFNRSFDLTIVPETTT